MAIDRSLFHPDYKPEPYWWEAARPSADGSADLPDSTEILIVGSGYAGLAAALELARAGRDVTVVDAQALGEGASSRSGGGVSAGINIGKGIAGGPGQADNLAASRQLLEELLAESRAAYDFVTGLIEAEGIQCHLEKRGRFVGAFAPAHFDGLQAKAEMLNRLVDIGARVVPRERQREEIASDFYFGGLALERTAKLHPALYYKGLLEVCRAAGVRLSAHTEVAAIAGARGRFSVRTSKGECRAEEVIVATNGYTGPLTPDLRKRIVPISSQIIVTEELPEDVASELIPNGRTISETPRITSYYRLTPGDRRVMYGGRARFDTVDPDLSAALLHGMMTRRWPQLKGVKITHSWSGLVAMTTDSMPHMGEIGGIHYCTGCNGSGIAMMTYMGNRVARRILDDGRSDSAFFKLAFPRVPVPFYSGKPWFLPIVGGYYRWRDRLERGRAM